MPSTKEVTPLLCALLQYFLIPCILTHVFIIGINNGCYDAFISVIIISLLVAMLSRAVKVVVGFITVMVIVVAVM